MSEKECNNPAKNALCASRKLASWVVSVYTSATLGEYVIDLLAMQQTT